MFVLKEDDEVDEEFYGPIFLGDPMTEPGYFDEPPLCVLFIVYNRFERERNISLTGQT